MMHKIFGQKQNAEYTDRKGAYLIPNDGDRIAIVKTAKGYFLIGGGIENGETDTECIKRECLEETGFLPEVEKFICCAEEYTVHSEIGLFHPIQSYYSGRLCEKVMPAKDKDHTLIWVTHEMIKGKMFSQIQNYAVEKYFEER